MYKDVDMLKSMNSVLNVFQKRLRFTSFLGLLFFTACAQQSTDTVDESTSVADSPGIAIDSAPQGQIISNDTTSALPSKDTINSLASFQAFYDELTKAFQAGDAAAIDRFIHPKWGIYIIDRPGAIDVIDTAASISGYFKKIYMGKERLKDMSCKLEEKKIPKVTCDKEYKGCYTEAADGYNHITELKTALLQYEFIKAFPPSEKARVKAFEALVKRNVVNFNKAIGLSFLRIDGKWYIGVIDLARYSCSA